MAYSTWSGHALLGRLAYDALPDWQKELIQLDLSPAAMAKPYFPPSLADSGDKMGFLCAIMDLVYYDDCRPYATLPDGRWIPHGPPDANWQAAGGSGQPKSLTQYVKLIELLLERTIAPMREGNWEEAVRHGGALAHFIQEPFTPGHAVDNAIFHELFPDPVPDRHMRLHHAFDNACGEITPPPPRLMGTSIHECAFRLLLDIERGIRCGKRIIWPVIRSVYEGFPQSMQQQLLKEQSRMAVAITTSAWYTAICIARDRFDPSETAALDRLPLLDIDPYFFHAWQYVETLPGCLVQNKRKIPIHVYEQRNGSPAEVEIADGFGMGGHMGIKWFVDGDLYPRFTCEVGLPSRQLEGQTEHLSTRFHVEMDATVNQVYSEDIEYQARSLAVVDLKAGEPLRKIEVDITGARSLILRAQSQPYTDPATGRIAFSIPHIAVCRPALSR